MTCMRASVEIGGEDFRFCAAHTGLHDGRFESLHGHTYIPVLTLHGRLDGAGMVMDFRAIKTVLREVILPLRSRTLLAGEATEVSLVRDGDTIQMSCGRKSYSLPAEDVVVLPVGNTTTEELAGYMLKRIVPKLNGSVRRVELRLLESPGTAVAVTADLGVGDR